MAVISITITESAEQIVSGIPRSVSITTNIPTTIFYTLDGSSPNLFSTIYTFAIQLPTDKLIFTLSIFATDGVTNSSIVTSTYQTILTGKNVRTPHSGTNAQPNSVQGLNDPYPFGSTPIMPGQIFLGSQQSGLTVDNPLLTEFPTGFDGFGNPTGFVNEPLIGIPTETQPVILSETNAQGERGNGIGTLPKSTIQSPVPPPLQQEYTSPQLFDPRALVIFQDFTKPNDPTKPVMINRQHFSLEDVNNTRDGNQYYNTGLDNAGTTGSFLRQHYNPADQTMTYYYRDSASNRWIISKTPYTPTADSGKYYNVVMSNKPGMEMVFRWIQFKGNFLY